MSHQTVNFPENLEQHVQVDMINGHFDLNDKTLEFMKLVREKISKVAKELEQNNLVKMDEETHRAAIRALQHAKNLYCDAAIIGSEVAKRKGETLENALNPDKKLKQ